MSDQSPTNLAGDLAALLASTPAHPPGQDALASLGGWERIAAEAAYMANSPILAQLVSLVVRDAARTDQGTDGYADAVRAVTAAVTAAESPAIFGDSLEILLNSPPVLDVAGPQLAAALGDIAGSFQKLESSDPRTARRAADAVEALTRLALAGIGSQYALLAILERFNAPQPKPVGTAVVRAIGTAIDHWPHAADLTSNVRLVAGIDPAKGTARNGADPHDVASDATWVLAGIELVSALRASELTVMTRHLETCAAHLRTAAETYGREDSGVLLTLVEILLGLLQESGVPPAVEALAMPQLAPDALEALAERIRRINVASIGLNHWYGDPKTAALHAWTRLANDLHRLRVEFARDSFYKAEVVVDDLLQIYMGSRSVTVVRRDADADGLQMLVQPVIETGFARTAGLLSNLEDHTDALEQQVTEAAHDRRPALTEQLEASRAVLAAARTHALGGTGQGKDPGGTATTPLPPPLDRLVPHGSPVATELASLSKETLVDLARVVDNATIGRHSLSLIESDIFTHIRALLTKSADFRTETADAIDELLRLVIRFVTTRTNAQSNLYGYLFDPNANEDAVHQDLYNYLIGNSVGSIAEFEVQHVGGGRVDLRIRFDGFAIHIEMKVDSTKIAIDDKTAYLKQAIAYQGSDIRIGFLVALRHKAFDASGPTPHISRLIGHAEFDVDGDTIPRHIITVEIPGSRTKPSEMK